jgi:hypothetical protein
MMGGGMVGLQYTAIKSKLKSKLNGIVNYETWVPSAKLMAPAADFFKKYQARAQGIDPLGYYLGGWGYAYLQVLADGITGSKSINDDKIAISAHPRVQHHHGVRHQVRQKRRMDQIRNAAGPVSRHHRSREPRDLARHELSDGAHARRGEDWQHHLSVREGVGISFVNPPPRSEAQLKHPVPYDEVNNMRFVNEVTKNIK